MASIVTNNSNVKDHEVSEKERNNKKKKEKTLNDRTRCFHDRSLCRGLDNYWWCWKTHQILQDFPNILLGFCNNCYNIPCKWGDRCKGFLFTRHCIHEKKGQPEVGFRRMQIPGNPWNPWNCLGREMFTGTWLKWASNCKKGKERLHWRDAS